MKRQDRREQNLSNCATSDSRHQNEAWSGQLMVPRDSRTDAVPEQESKTRRGRYSESYLVQMYANEALETPLLTVEEERRLGLLNQQGDETARQRLILSNLRLVVSIASTFSDYGLELADLIALGNSGLIKAVERFDPTQGAKFSTYSSWWIKQAIRRGLTHEAATIRVPAHAQQKARELIKAERQLTTELDREPTLQELSKRVGLTEEQIHHIRKSSASRHTVSLEAPLSADSSEHNSTLLSDTLADPNITPTGEALVRDERHQLVRAIVGDRDSLESLPESLRQLLVFHRSKFTDRELVILTERFGLGSAGETTQTLEQLGSKYGVTRERIRQLEARALSKVKKALEHIDRQRHPELEKVVATAKKEASAQSLKHASV